MGMNRKPTPLFDNPDEAECPALLPAMIENAQKVLGLKLPEAYLAAMRQCNGGYLRRNAFPNAKAVDRVPSRCWHADHVQIRDLMGIGGDKGIDSRLGSNYLILEWGYPKSGVVISSEGHTAFMLDYGKCGPKGEPS